MPFVKIIHVLNLEVIECSLSSLIFRYDSFHFEEDHCCIISLVILFLEITDQIQLVSLWLNYLSYLEAFLDNILHHPEVIDSGDQRTVWTDACMLQNLPTRHNIHNIKVRGSDVWIQILVHIVHNLFEYKSLKVH